jgi:hypothetical protein
VDKLIDAYDWSISCSIYPENFSVAIPKLLDALTSQGKSIDYGIKLIKAFDWSGNDIDEVTNQATRIIDSCKIEDIPNLIREVYSEVGSRSSLKEITDAVIEIYNIVKTMGYTTDQVIQLIDRLSPGCITAQQLAGTVKKILDANKGIYKISEILELANTMCWKVDGVVDFDHYDIYMPKIIETAAKNGQDLKVAGQILKALDNCDRTAFCEEYVSETIKILDAIGNTKLTASDVGQLIRTLDTVSNDISRLGNNTIDLINMLNKTEYSPKDVDTVFSTIDTNIWGASLEEITKGTIKLMQKTYETGKTLDYSLALLEDVTHAIKWTPSVEEIVDKTCELLEAPPLRY